MLRVDTYPIDPQHFRMSDMTVHKRQMGMSLIEILVVISTSAALMGILLPSLGGARKQAQRTVCLNNLRQMTLAAHAYCAVYDDHYPLAFYTERVNGVRRYLAWDLSTWKDWNVPEPINHIAPGLLWMGQSVEKVQQCPVFKRPANWFEDPYTGYNYNTSFIGRNETVHPVHSARSTEVRFPAKTALFGDGEYANGANKFMRAPLSNPRDASFSDSSRHGGVQGFRHLNTTSVSFCDGHAQFLRGVYTDTSPESKAILDEYNQNEETRIGFLSVDNRLYDLK